MLAKLIRTDDNSVVLLQEFADVAALAAENDRAQGMTDGLLSWEEATPFEQGLYVGLTLPTIGGKQNERSE